MSIKLSAATAMASGRPIPTPMPAAAPVDIPPLSCCVDVHVGLVAFSVLGLVVVDGLAVEVAVEVAVEDAVEVAPLSKRSVDRAAFITAL